MLLKQLLERPRPASNLQVYNPFGDLDYDELVDQVIRLANADIDGPRYILFGVNAGAIEGSGIVGIDESLIADLKKAHRLLSARIAPVLELAFIYDKINFKLVGALEIDGCDNGPYGIDPEYFDTVVIDEPGTGQDAEPRTAEGAGPEHDNADEVTEPVVITVTFSEPPDCELLKLAVPDASNPPSAREKRKLKQHIDWKKAIRDTIDTVNTGIMRLAFARQHGSDAEFDQGSDDTLSGKFNGIGKQFVEADKYYFFEEKALKVNLTVCNKGTKEIEAAKIEISLPRTRSFDVADRLYIDPDDDAPLKEADMCSYPEVRRSKEAIWVRQSLGSLAPDSPKPAFECALRLVVGPRMQGRKVGIGYTLRGKNNQVLDTGRLKIKFGRVGA